MNHSSGIKFRDPLSLGALWHAGVIARLLGIRSKGLQVKRSTSQKVPKSIGLQVKRSPSQKVYKSKGPQSKGLQSKGLQKFESIKRIKESYINQRMMVQKIYTSHFNTHTLHYHHKLYQLDEQHFNINSGG